MVKKINNHKLNHTRTALPQVCCLALLSSLETAQGLTLLPRDIKNHNGGSMR